MAALASAEKSLPALVYAIRAPTSTVRSSIVKFMLSEATSSRALVGLRGRGADGVGAGAGAGAG